jgi:hypothetical protein
MSRLRRGVYSFYTFLTFWSFVSSVSYRLLERALGSSPARLTIPFFGLARAPQFFRKCR